ncbi:hypothetical protein KAFR_0G00310 [Kazachstania africana CBS 2517]|uniref:Uncharacterized protein n=1 Tax=Kazachstania africana (strain ATCC 22294 / BCRC 22015 / CBS 2517 / CECT 1963 / NBRC 1671 / NRRL Y-8276) TaxID=1071382 RepID=H2AXG4_KAZAF|nr:hypothetical protein KAFR_0G00310 [Kazachstania africana CBS 2517]CCF59064.1 hypothetical protein KAFR_0G00310 [Kazachstania africana CBS 2517]
MSLQRLRMDEERYQETLQNLRELCQASNVRPMSLLDPMWEVKRELDLMTSLLKIISSKHADYFKQLNEYVNMDDLFDDTSLDLSLLQAYKSLLASAAKLILNPDISTFRSGNQKFLTHILEIYSRLCTVLHSHDDANTFSKLYNIISSFEDNFYTKYNQINSRRFESDQVYDFLSFSKILTKSPGIDLNDVRNSTLFELGCEKFGYHNLLVELAQVSTGEIAIFKINAGKLQTSFNQLLHELKQGNYTSLNFGRTLLFLPLTMKQLQIMSFSTMETTIKSTSGNNAQLHLKCLDPIQWSVTWKPIFDNSLSKEKESVSLQDSFGTITEGKTFESDNFYMKFNELPATEGITVVNSDALYPRDLSSAHQVQSDLGQDVKSQDITPKMESIETSKEVQITNSELIDGIATLTSATSMDIPDLHQLKIDNTKSEKRFDKVPVNDIFINTKEEKVTPTTEFNPSADFYKPTLHKKKSGLLSFFHKSNKKRLSIETDIDNNTSFFSSPISTSGTPTSSIFDSQSKEIKQYVKPLIKNESPSSPIFEFDSTKMSIWRGTKWELLSNSKSRLDVSKSLDGTYILMAYHDKSNDECHFVAELSNTWTCARSTAQDIQIRIPRSTFVSAAFAIHNKTCTISIRCVNADKLMNSLQHCIKGNLPESLSSSTTIRTLSTSSSSFMSEGIMKSYTQETFISDSKQSIDWKAFEEKLLLPNLKARQYSRIDGKLWQIQNTGVVDIFFLEKDCIRELVKFSLKTEDHNVVISSSYLDSVKRIGRTGISLCADDGPQLFEFLNPQVTDQVYKIVVGR